MLSSLKYAVWKSFRAVGLDIRRTRPPETQRWLGTLGIQTVLDIGANRGQYYGQIRSLLPDATVHSFEPLADCFAELERAGASDPLFHAHPYGLGAGGGTRSMNRSSFAQSSSLLPMASAHKDAFPHSRGETVVEVEVRRLDDVAQDLAIRTPLLVKIDVQGSEAEVIEGGEATLASAGVLIVETSYRVLYTGQPLFADVHDRLIGMGFVFQGNLGQLLDPRDGAILQGDSIFVKAGG